MSAGGCLRARAHTRAHSRAELLQICCWTAPERHLGTWALPAVGWENVAVVAKKWLKSLAVSELFRTFAGMKRTEPKDEFLVTGLSRLSGMREELTGVMPLELAQQRMERYKLSTRKQRYPTYTRLRVERRLPIQLTIKFE